MRQPSFKGLWVVFAKPPVPGRVKTRLAADIGPEAAAELARAFLVDTVGGLPVLPGWDVRLSTPEPAADHGVRVPAWEQGGGDLGARLERAYRRGFAEGYDGVVALGADSPGCPPDRLVRAARHLASGRWVMGPAEDGGFDLLGLTACPVGTLADLPWSTEQTGARVGERLSDLGRDLVRLDPWFDVDRIADLRRLHRDVPPERLPQTWPVLKRVLGGAG